jgi:hypothetical protein
MSAGLHHHSHHHTSPCGVGAVAKLDAALIVDVERSVHEQRLHELKRSEDVRYSPSRRGIAPPLQRTASGQGPALHIAGTEEDSLGTKSATSPPYPPPLPLSLAHPLFARLHQAAISAFGVRLSSIAAGASAGGPGKYSQLDIEMALTKSKELARSLEVASERADRAELQARGFAKEAQRLSAALLTSAADREELLQTLIACRKALARAEGELAIAQAAAREAQGRADDERVAGEELAGEKSSARGPEEARARALQLQALLEGERRASREARRELLEERARRTEAEMVLRAAVEEARAEVGAARAEVMRGGAAGAAAGGAQGGSAVPPTKPPRSELLAELLSRDAVLAALPAVVFPGGHARAAAEFARREAAAAAAGASPQKK